MPGSSVSACHLCHLHSHNHENLVKTSPLRHSRWKNGKHSNHSTHSSHSTHTHRHHGHSHGHSHNHSHGSCPREDGERVRTSSASALARLTESSHSLPGSRSNSLSRYHREVSILPDGGDTYDRTLRHSNSTRSLDNNPAPVSTTILETRAPSLPRISTPLHSQPQIHAQPDILVNAMPRSRTNSRSSGSLPRTTANHGQDTSHDYYLDMQRQRFKEDEKKKHKFNLQTVMLIGCYTLLIMIAIVVGVVLCYQNGWLGLGSSQSKLSEERMFRNNSNFEKRDSLILQNRRKHSDKNINRETSTNGRTQPKERENGNLNNFRSTSVIDFSSASSLSPNVHRQVPPARNDGDFNHQRNSPRQHSNLNTSGNRVRALGPEHSVNSHQNTQGMRQDNGDRVVLNNHRIPTSFGENPNFNQRIPRTQSPVSRLSHSTNEDFAGNFPSQDFNNPSQTPINNKNVPSTNRGNVNGNVHPNFQTGIPLNSNTNTGIPLIHNSNIPRNIQTLSKPDAVNRGNFNSNIPSNFRTGIPLNTNFNTNSNSGSTSFNRLNNNDNTSPHTVSHPRIPRINNDHSQGGSINGNLQTGVPLNTNSDLNTNANFNNGHVSTSNRNSQTLSPPVTNQNRHQRNNPIIQQRNNPTIQQRNNPTIQQGNNPTIQQRHNPTIQQESNPTIHQTNTPSTPQGNNDHHPQRNTPALQQGNLNTNTIAKTLLQGGFVFPGLTGRNIDIPTPNSNVHHKSKDENIRASFKNSNNPFTATSGSDSLFPSISDKLLTSDTSSLTTQELLDLLAIRRMRDLLNAKENTRDILDLLRKVDQSKDTRLEPVREETLAATQLQDRTADEQIARRGSGRNIKGTLRSDPENAQIHELIEALQGRIINTDELSARPVIPSINRDNIGLDSPPIDNHSSSLKGVINKTINGAIIRLLNERNSDLKTGSLEPKLNFNISGVSVFPVNSEDLRILLGSNSENIHDDFGLINSERLRSLHLLKTLIDLNNEKQKQKVQRHIDSTASGTPNAGDSSIFESEKSNSRNVTSPSLVTQSRGVTLRTRKINPSSRISQFRPTRRTVKTSGGSLNNFAPAREEVSTTAESILVSRRRRPSISSRLRAPKPDPEFAVMVKTEKVTEPAKTRKAVFPPPFQTRNQARRTVTSGHSPPNKERVIIQPGRRRGRGNTALVRAWTHMDSTGTLSKGSVHSDGSFTFTNCKPVSVCDDEKQDSESTTTKTVN